jgi:hypothetical protein
MLALSATLPPGASAQSLPILHPANLAAESRTGLYFQPFVPASEGWRISGALDYASVLELAFRLSPADTLYLQDSEVLRINLAATHDLGRDYFVSGEAWVGGSYNGFLDGFLNWYHHLLGIRYPEREDRPRNHYDYFYRFAGGRVVRFDRTGLGLGDVRLGVGRRHTDRFQSVLSLTLPTSTMGQGNTRGTVSVSLLNTFRAPLTPRLVYEGSANLGFTPRNGPLASFQNRVFVLGTSGLRWRTTGQLWSFANLFLHSPYYSGTGASALDQADLTIDFGWMIRGKSGREFRFGMTEDLRPTGPAVDANFRLGMTW